MGMTAFMTIVKNLNSEKHCPAGATITQVHGNCSKFFKTVSYLCKDKTKSRTMAKKLVVGITQGDSNGIGYETIIKAFSDERQHFQSAPTQAFLSDKVLLAFSHKGR